MVSERGESPDRKKIKTVDAELSEKIIAQLEYYFSDVNVVKDKFMREEFAKDNGYITIQTLLKFAKLKDLAKDQTTVVDALNDCKSDLIELDEKRTKIKRKKPLMNEEEIKKVEQDIDSRTLHLSGFPLDFNYDHLVRWCRQFGDTDSVSLRRFYKLKKFKGNILVTYKSKEDADKLMKESALKCKDREIRKENMEMYRKRKQEYRKRRQEKSSKRREISDNK